MSKSSDSWNDSFRQLSNIYCLCLSSESYWKWWTLDYWDYQDNVFNSTRNNLHNHPLPKPSKVPGIIHELVKQAVRCNPSITPGQLSLGNNCALTLYNTVILINVGIGTGFMLTSVSSAAHLKHIYRKAVKEISAAAGPSGVSIIDTLDSAFDALNMSDKALSDGGNLAQY